MPAARTSTRTSPGPGRGFGRRAISRTSGPPWRGMTTALIVSVIVMFRARRGPVPPARSGSAPFEPWRTLIDVGGQPLARVVRGEQLLLQLALQRQRLGERQLGARRHGALDPPDRQGSPAGRAEGARVAQDLRLESVRLEQAVDETHRLRVLEREGAARGHQLE